MPFHNKERYVNDAWRQIVGDRASLATLISSTIAIVGVLLAACLSIGGIALNNWFHSKRLEREQAHDREQRELERARAMQKDIFVEAAAAMVSHLNAVQSFANTAVPIHESLKVILSATPTIAKANLVCSQETAAALSAMSSELSRVTRVLGMLRNESDTKQSEFDLSIKSHDGLLNEQRRLFSISEEMQRIKQATQDEWTRMNDRLDENRALVVQAGHRIEESLQAFKIANLALVATMQDESLILRNKMRPVVRAVRKDIGYPATELTLDAMFAPFEMPTREQLAASMGLE